MPHRLQSLAFVLTGSALMLRKNQDGRASPPAEDRASAVHGQALSPKSRSSAGAGVDSPAEIPPQGWIQIARRTLKEFSDDQVPMVAAGCTFYTLLALFPAIGAFMALYGLFADPADAQRNIQTLSALLPGGAIKIIGDQMSHVAGARHGGLSAAFAFGLLASIWSANGAVKALMTGLNIAYDEHESRSFLRKTLTSLGLTLGALVFIISSVALLAAKPALKTYVGAGPANVLALVTWPLMFVGLVVGLALLYRFGPNRAKAPWRWISWGSGLAALAWVAMSAAFSFYAANFGHFDKSYGPLGAVIGLLIWAWLSAMVVLLGAELNAEMEHQAEPSRAR
jgi:membrane protein